MIETIHTGYLCNNRCLFCAQGRLRATEPQPSDGEVRQALEQACTRGGRRVTFVGGEPTIRDELPGWLEAARRLGVGQVALQTNGRRLAYRAYTTRLARAGAGALDISLHGPRAEIHDHHTRVPGSFRQSLAGLAEAQTAGIEVGITMVMTRSNFRHLVQMVQWVTSLGVKSLHLASAQGRGEAARLLARVVPRLALLRPRLVASARLAHALGIRLFVSGVPLCLLPRQGALVLQPPALDAHLFLQSGACTRCTLRSSCAGISRIYLDRYGDRELGALSRSPAPPPERGAGMDRGRGEIFTGLGRTEPPPQQGNLPDPLQRGKGDDG